MKILAIQNRMGIGDTVIFLPYIRELSKKFKIPIDLLVRENSKADQFLEKTNYIGQMDQLAYGKTFERFIPRESVFSQLEQSLDDDKYPIEKESHWIDDVSNEISSALSDALIEKSMDPKYEQSDLDKVMILENGAQIAHDWQSFIDEFIYDDGI